MPSVRSRPDQPEFSVQTGTTVDGRTKVTVAGDVDIATAERFAAAVREPLRAGPVLVDLREVSFFDSSGVRALHTLLRECDEHGWEMRLCSQLPPSVAQVLELTGMTGVLALEDCEP